MSGRRDGGRPTAEGREPSALQGRRPPRLRLRFDGALDDVPLETAAALARVTRILLGHQSQHAGRTVTMRISSTRSRVGIWVVDPECSEACLSEFGRLAAIRAERIPGVRDVSLHCGDSVDGLRLTWSVHLPRLARGRTRLRTRIADAVLHPRHPAGRGS
jgi:hypothetical protein